MQAVPADAGGRCVGATLQHQAPAACVRQRRPVLAVRPMCSTLPKTPFCRNQPRTTHLLPAFASAKELSESGLLIAMDLRRCQSRFEPERRLCLIISSSTCCTRQRRERVEVHLISGKP